jgi:protein SCO1
MSPLRTFIALVLLVAAAFAAMAPAPPALAHDPQDDLLAQVGVDEKLGGRIPSDLRFTDQNGSAVLLSSYFTGRPVILTLNYFSCPTLCSLTLKNLVGTIGDMRGLTLGRDFRVVTVSIDPAETLARAADKSAKTYAMLRAAPDPQSSWPFLIGEQPSISALAGTVGVRYAKAKNGEFAHPNVIVIVTPDGRVSRYLYGLEQDPKDLKLALLEAAGGNIGSSKILNRALLYCFHYDPVGKKYVLLATRVMTGAMLVVLVLTIGLLAALWRRDNTFKGEKHA